MKIALLGGTFDPFHADHLSIIKQCKEVLKFDEVWVIPTFQNPFKLAVKSTPEDRINMINLGINKLDYVKVVDKEIKSKAPSYTFDTVKWLKKEYPNNEFTFIIGSDQLQNLEQWHRFEELLKEVNFICFERMTTNFDIANKYNVQVIKFNNLHLSSTKLRDAVEMSKQLPVVNEYINNKLLYLASRLKMSPKRLQHSINVGECAEELAKINNIDPQIAKIAGTLHDVAKEFSDEKLSNLIIQMDKNLLNEPKSVWHGFAGYVYLKNEWLIDNEEILNAVFKHTVGDENMSALDKIVFCADKISKERTYHGVEELRKLTFQNLDAGFKEILKNQYNVALEKFGEAAIGEKIKKTYKKYVG
ncbi:nicotinate-nucleotide adenylyltransferase [Spiroplasma endosymbiont of Crioceris asparagi]|uniref:nicotinate-nucleotide adenylyltransferase n=1 Tax=Spiroplasma endosymbiont of Crioceris asparagi TaxID=3066286 RepID=UPI0030D0B5A9